jgi:VCBS repeat-containing protein
MTMTHVERQAVRTRRSGRARKAARSRRLGLERLEDRLAPVGDFGFAFGLGGPSNDQGLAIATDSAGNVFVAGAFVGSADFDPGPGVVTLSTPAGSAAGTTDAFVAKYDPAGNLLWARRMGGTASDRASALAVDDLGDVHVAGQFAGTSATFGGTTLASAGSNDVFVTDLDGAGNFLWTQRVGGTGDDAARGIAVDAARSTHVVGQFTGTVDFNPDPVATANLTSGGSTDVFVLKLDAVGGFTWARGFGSSGADLGLALALDPSGNVYTTGIYRSSINDFDPGAGTTTLPFAGGNQDLFLSKLDSAGNFAWARGIGGPQSETGASLAADAAGNVYLAGSFASTVDFDPDPVGTFLLTAPGPSPTSSDAFVAKYTTAGGFAWAGRLGSPVADDFANGVTLDAAGNLYVVGTYTALADLNPDPADPYTLAGGLTPTTATSSTYVDKLDPAGHFVWARSFDGGNLQLAAGITVDGKGRVYTTGTFGGTVDFDPNPTATFNLTSASSTTGGSSLDAFVAQLTQLASTGDATTAADADGYALDTDNDGTFDAVNTTDDVILTRNAFTSLRSGLMEFDLSGIDPRSTIQAATLTVVVNQLEGLVGEPINVAIDAYAGDGVITTADATVAATQVGQASNLDLGTLSIPLSTSFLQSLLGTGSQVGLRVRLLSGTGVGFASTESPLDSPPTLTFTLGPPATNFAPASNNDAYFFNEDTTLTVPLNAGVLDNDSDLNGNPLTATLVSGPSVGTLSFNPDGTFTYTPPPNFNGIVPFTYKANDGTADGNVATVFLLINPVDDAPVAVDDPTYSTNEDKTLSVAAPGVLANDTDIDNPATDLTASVVSPPSRGTLVLQPDGSFVYFPPANFNGVVTFTYRVSDGQLFSAPATATITVNPVNDPPQFFIAGPLTVTVDEDAGAQSFANYTTGMAPGPSSATDEAGQALSFLVTVTGTTGGLTFSQAPAISPTGTLTFTAAANSNGTATLSVVLTDDGGTANGGVDRSDPRTVTIVVNAVNDPPVAGNDAYTTAEDTALVVAAPGVLGNDSDVDSPTLTASLVTGPAHGTLALNADGSFTYTPAADFNGTDSFTYKASDGSLTSNVATVTLTVTPVNDAPVAANDAYTTAEDTPLSVAAPGVLGNDSDVDSPTLTVSLVTGPAHGTLVLNGNGAFTYTPLANYNGPDSFTYKANDGSLDSNVATVSITVTAVNDAPAAADDSYATDEDTALTVAAPGLLGNDTDVDGDALSAILVSGPAHGTLTLNGNGSFTYTPAANYNGTDTFTYKASDGSLDSAVATVTLTVRPVNDAPVARDDAYTLAEDSTLTVAAPGVLGNDTDADGDALSAILVAGPAHGTVVLNGNGSLTYTPLANYNGPDSFTYRASDGSLNSGVATVSINVTPVNDAPTAAGDSYTTAEDTALTVAAPGVLGNDTDVDGDALSAALVSGPTHGTLALNANGSFTYTPAANYNGPDSFTYRASDGLAVSNVATVALTVTPVNDAPTARDDAYSVVGGGSLDVAAPGVLGNDADADGDPLAAVLVGGPAHGTLTLNADGSFRYVPAAGFSGPDSFTYRAGDGSAASNLATVTINVTPPASELLVKIDIMPDDPKNKINLNSAREVPVAILSTQVARGEGLDFNALTVDPRTIRFGDVRAGYARVAPLSVAIQDVDRDGDLDLVAFFTARQLQQARALDPGSVAAELTASTTGGRSIRGVDSVQIIGPDHSNDQMPSAGSNLSSASSVASGDLAIPPDVYDLGLEEVAFDKRPGRGNSK